MKLSLLAVIWWGAAFFAACPLYVLAAALMPVGPVPTLSYRSYNVSDPVAFRALSLPLGKALVLWNGIVLSPPFGLVPSADGRTFSITAPVTAGDRITVVTLP